MKQIQIILPAILLLCQPLAGQEQIPESTKYTFQRLYPKADYVYWQDQQDAVVATFLADQGLKKTLFTDSGEWIETRLRMTSEELPAGVQKFIRENYRGAEIVFCGRVYNENGAWFRIESEYADRTVLRMVDWFGDLIIEKEILYEDSNATTENDVELKRAMPLLRQETLLKFNTSEDLN